MNDRNAAMAIREIALANEPDFRLADSEVHPSSLEVAHQGEIVELEPRVMQVLVALHRKISQPVSRQDLVELCWAGRVVTEGALNRSIAQLRKALRDPGIRIDTVPTVGYRLNASGGAPSSSATPALGIAPLAPVAAAITTVTAPPPASVPPALSQGKDAFARKLALAIVGCCAVAGGAVWWHLETRPIVWTATAYHPLTSTPDQETFPALSEDGGQIIYAARPEGYGPRNLYLRNVNDGTPIRLTNNPADSYGASWSPGGDRIAFVRSRGEGPCQLLIMPVPVGPERVVTQCETVRDTRVSWLNTKTLLYADRPANLRVTLLRAVDIDSGRITDLTSPPISTLGDADPQAARDGRHVVFHRSLTLGADDLFALDLATGMERPLTTDGWKANGSVWSADSRYIFFATNRGGDFGLWSVDREGREPPHRVSLGFGTVSFTRMSADRQNRLAVELSQGRGELTRMSLSGQVDMLTAGVGYEVDAAVAPDGAIAYVSNRSGSYELWLLLPGKESLRLTAIQGSYMVGPSWSPDGQRLAFVAVTDRRADIFTVGRDGSHLRRLTSDGASKKDVVFSGAHLLYLSRVNGRWRLLDVADTPVDSTGSAARAEVRGEDDWSTLRGAPDGSIFGQREGEKRIRLVAAGTSSGVGDSFYAGVQIGHIDTWAVGAEGVYIRRRGTMQPSSIWFFPWDGSARKLADVPLAYGPIAVDNDGAVIFSQNSTSNIDLAMVELRPQS